MTSTYTTAGITLDRYADVKARLQALAVAKWGESINLAQDSYLGHEIENESLLLGEINEVWQAVLDSFSMENSVGNQTAVLISLIGLEREAAAYSSVTLTLTATKACTVPAGTIYGTESGVNFATDSELVFVAAGDDDVESTCTIVGEFNAAISEVDQIVTSVYGISAVDNAAAAIPGRLQETSDEMKVRHSVITAESGSNASARIYRALTEVTGVSSVYILNNNTNAAIGSVQSKNIHVVVIGGSDADVATAIDNNITESVPTYGSESYSVYNTEMRQSTTIYFDRAVDLDTYISLEVLTNSTFPTDGEQQIKDALTTHYDDELGIGDDVRYNGLYAPIYSVTGVTHVSALTLGEAATPTGTSDITVTSSQRAATEDAFIVVTVS